MGNTPNIRFKGFTDDWEQRKLSEFGEATGGTSIESEFSADGIYKVISIGSYSEDNIYRDQGIRAVRSDKTINRILNKGDITMILNDKTASGNIIGRVLLIEESGVYVYNQRTERIEVGCENYNSQFIYTMLNAPEIRDKIIKQSQGNTQIYVNWTTVSQTDYLVPQIEEQIKIGEYFKSIDNLITLHQRKCDEMKKMKKFMLQKMFPKNGQKNPEIRFDGFTDDWEQRKLGEVVEKVTTKNNDTQYIETFTNSAELGIMSQRDYFDHDVSNIENISGYYIVENDAFVYNPRISTSAPVGPINRNKLGRTGVMSPLYTVFKVNGIDSEYLEWYFKSTGWHSFMKFNGDSGARSDRFSIKDSVFFEMPIPTPDIDEQEKIGEYFSSLDHLITLHQRKVENLKNLKKYMLQNMFV